MPVVHRQVRKGGLFPAGKVTRQWRFDCDYPGCIDLMSAEVSEELELDKQMQLALEKVRKLYGNWEVLGSFVYCPTHFDKSFPY